MRSSRSLGVGAGVLIGLLAACDSHTPSEGTGPQLLVVQPRATTLQAGNSVQLQALMVDGSAASRALEEVVWYTSDSRIAAVDGRGMVLASRAGVAEITAWSSGVRGVSTVTVAPGGPVGGPCGEAATAATPRVKAMKLCADGAK